MKYINTSQTEVAPAVAAKIIDQLERGRSVLWLMSGGSGGKVCVDASKLLVDHDLTGLYVTMSDERYGELGHAEENFQQLLDGGLYIEGATWYRPLQGADRQKTTEDFADWLEDISQQVDYRFAVLGIGEDGHTMGVKPHSPAVSATTVAESFEGDDFERVTVTPKFMSRLDGAIVQAYGPKKHDVVRRLLAKEGDLESFPALSIHDIDDVTVYSDADIKS